MFMTFRNLVLLTVLCAVVTSLGISDQKHTKYNNHMLRIHQTAYHSFEHDEENSNAQAFTDNANTVLKTIKSSIHPDIPAILDTKSLPVLAFNSATCKDLNDEQKSNLTDNVKVTKQAVNDFKTNVQDQKITADANNALQYVNAIQLFLNRNCDDFGNILIGPSPYQTNINTPKSWILGSMTSKDLVNKYISNIQKNDNLTNCGLNTPFWTGLKCISCSEPTPIFDLSQSKCVACPDGQGYDFDSKKCVVQNQPKPADQAESKCMVPANAPNDALKNYIESGAGDKCPSDKPFVQNGQCISCPDDKSYFNIVTKQCASCPPGIDFDPSTHQCKQPGSNKPNPLAESKSLVPSNAPKNALQDYLNSGSPDSNQCPEDKPNVDNSGNCISCPDDKSYFNIVSKECQPCPDSAPYDISIHNCKGGSYKPNGSAQPKCLVPDGAPDNALPNYLSTGDTQCPQDQPNVKDNTCLKCSDDKPYFNIVSKSCQACPIGQSLDSTIHKCVKPIATDVPTKTPNLKMNDNSTDTDWNNYVDKNADKPLCGVDLPYWDGAKCISCPELFNVITSKCDTCPGGFSLNTNTHKCQPATKRDSYLIDLFNAIF